MSQQSKLGPLESFVLGGASAIVFRSAFAPLERVKLLRQCQGEIVKQGRIAEPYDGAIDCIVRTYRNEGILAFWRGNLIHCLYFFPLHALNFALKEKMKDIFKSSESDSTGVAFLKNVASGVLTGVISLCFVYSLDYARVKLTTDVKVSDNEGSERQFNGVVDVYKKTLKSDGFVGLYRGFIISCVGIIVYRGCYFGLYYTFKTLLLGENASAAASFALGFAATVCAGLLSYPLDTIQLRMMMTSGQAVKYKGSWDCAAQIMRNEGAMPFMNGLGVTILRGIAGALLFAGFNKVKAAYVQWRA